MASSDSRPLAGKIALVTGASRGIGKAIAIELAAAGAITYITARTLNPQPGSAVSLTEAAEEMQRLGGNGIAVPCDHTDDDAVQAVFDRIAAEHGRLDILVNNAGIAAANKLLEGSGASGLYTSRHPYGRIVADITAARQHITNNVALHARDWGQVMLGQPRRHDFML